MIVRCPLRSRPPTALIIQGGLRACLRDESLVLVSSLVKTLLKSARFVRLGLALSLFLLMLLFLFLARAVMSTLEILDQPASLE